MLNGITHNDAIDTDRYFNNVDTRWTNTSIQNVTLNTSWKQVNEGETLVSPANAPIGDYTLPSGLPNTSG